MLAAFSQHRSRRLKIDIFMPFAFFLEHLGGETKTKSYRLRATSLFISRFANFFLCASRQRDYEHFCWLSWFSEEADPSSD
jgi:hypothetical protein